MANFYLAIESATKMCSIALFKDQILIDQLEEGGDYSHAEKLAPFVEVILKKNTLTAKDLSAIAVSSGPGSYTGLRIGLSLAKGMCFAANIPLISISTLKGMAFGARKSFKESDVLFVPMIDARRMEVYSAIFDGSLAELKPTDALIIDEDSFQEYLQKSTMVFFGDGAAKCKSTLTHSNALFLNENFISSSYWGELIHEKFLKEQFEDLAYYEPYYYKDFRAGKPKPLL